MAQVRIYGHRDHLNRQRTAISNAIHRAAMETLGLPAGKRFHRFIGLDASDFIHPDDRSFRYTIIEFSMFRGRSREAKRALIRALFRLLADDCDIPPQDVEITISETPRANWGIRGVPADELDLDYPVEV